MKLFKNCSLTNYEIKRDEETNSINIYNNNLLIINLKERLSKDFEFNVHNNPDFYGVTLIHDVNNNTYGIWKDKSTEEYFITKLEEY